MAEVLVPKTLAELLPNINNEEKRITAGGTDIVVGIRSGRVKYKPMIDINQLEEIKVIYEDDDNVYIGSNVSLSNVTYNEIVKKNFSVMIKAIESIGSLQIRNRATLGGNIQNASPSGDSILALTVLRAKIVLRSLTGRRQVYIKEFIKGPGKTDLRNDEFIEYIVIPKVFSNYQGYFEKVGLRNAMVISIASLAVVYKLENNVFVDINMALGAVAPKVLQITEVEGFLRGKELNRENLIAAGELIGKNISPIDDVRASAEYRRQVCKNLILRLLNN